MDHFSDKRKSNENQDTQKNDVYEKMLIYPGKGMRKDIIRGKYKFKMHGGNKNKHEKISLLQK